MTEGPANMARLVLALLLAGVALAACSVDENAHPQHRECKSGEVDYKGYCYRPKPPAEEDSGSDDRDAETDAALDAMTDGSSDADAPDAATSQTCPSPGTIEFCYDEADKSTAMQQPCRAGTRTCREDGTWGTCEGQVRPRQDVCDGMDNDCDGAADEDQAQRTCEVKGGGAKGVCAEGFAFCKLGRDECVQAQFPGSEACDGSDNDCDGKTDEGTSEACYDGEVGCTLVNGSYECVAGSICATGEKQCVSGAMQTVCTGAVLPRDEANTAVGQRAFDEDCDGTVDEGFPCQDGELYGCYTGQAGTQNRSPCHEGQRTCNSAGELAGACIDERTPVAETCANEGTDDDCDGQRDDVPRRGTSCASASGAQGACRQNARWQCVSNLEQCVSGMAAAETCDGQMIDEDCDGKIDEGFNLQTDAANCGTCGHACAAGLSCCGGNCVSVQSSNSHCGACGTACGSGLTCCSGACRNLRSNDASNCGACGKSCLLLGCSNGTCNLL
jgi:hypothetical protein